MREEQLLAKVEVGVLYSTYVVFLKLDAFGAQEDGVFKAHFHRMED